MTALWLVVRPLDDADPVACGTVQDAHLVVGGPRGWTEAQRDARCNAWRWFVVETTDGAAAVSIVKGRERAAEHGFPLFVATDIYAVTPLGRIVTWGGARLRPHRDTVARW